MTAQLKTFSVVSDLKGLRQILVPDYQTIQERNRDDDYDNRWDWETTDVLAESSSSATTDGSADWMQRLMSSSVTISPYSDLMAFAKSSYLAVYRLKSPPQPQTLQPMATTDAATTSDNQSAPELHLYFETQLTDGQNFSETITSLLLVPIVSQQKSSVALYDWTAIVIGFSSGYFRVYTENGKLLLSQCFHDEPVMDIKCQTFRPNSPSDSDQLLVVYKTSVVIIDGFSLYQTLRLCRTRLAKNQSLVVAVDGWNSDPTLTFNYKKWRLDDGKVINDCQSCGSNTHTYLDNLMTISLNKGPNAQPTPVPTSDLLITCGQNPFVGFYTPIEPTTPILNELTNAMVSKVKNMIPFGGLFGGGGSGNKSLEDSPKNLPPIPIPLKLGMFDKKIGLSVSVSPNKQLAAVVDDFGRVTLIDIADRLAVRMWKGYRDAQVGWIEVQEEGVMADNNNKTAAADSLPKRVTFIVIYAPKRGILEVWCTQLGPRVGAFNVGKSCRLIQCQHSIMGLNALIVDQFNKSRKQQDLDDKCRCYLFDYNTGIVYHIDIPFLCALTDPNSKRTRDLHLFRELQQLLKSETTTSSSSSSSSSVVDKVSELVGMLKTAEMRRNAIIQEICQLKQLNVIKLVTTRLRDQLMASLEKNELDFENKLVIQMCARVLQLCRLYELSTDSIGSSSSSDDGHHQHMPTGLETNYITDSCQPPDIQLLIETLGWKGSDIARILSYIAFKDGLTGGGGGGFFDHQNNVDNSQSLPKATTGTTNTPTTTTTTITIADLLSHFVLYSNHLVTTTTTTNTSNTSDGNQELVLYSDIPVELNVDLTIGGIDTNSISIGSSNQLLPLSHFLFQTYQQTDGCLQLQSLLKSSCILPTNLLHLFFICWLSSNTCYYWKCWQYFHQSLTVLMDIIKQQDANITVERIDDEVEEEDRLSNDWRDILVIISESPNIMAALTAVQVIRSINSKDRSDANAAKQPQQQQLAVVGDYGSDDSEWETLHIDNESLNLMIKQLEDVFLLDMLLHSNRMKIAATNDDDDDDDDNDGDLGDNDHKYTVPNISLAFLLGSGPGIVSELVAKWAINSDLSPDIFNTLIETNTAQVEQMDQTSDSRDDDDEKVTITSDRIAIGQEAIEIDSFDLKTTVQLIDHVRRCFPNCVESDVLLVNCSWELMVRWNRDPTTQLVNQSLDNCLRYLSYVSSAVLKHNVSCLIWKTFVMKRFECLCQLIEKMGRTPKDRICRKELAITENQLEAFVDFANHLLELILNTNMLAEIEPLPLFSTDDWWRPQQSSIPLIANTSLQQQQQSSPSSASVMPLVVLAVHQKLANGALVLEHSRVATIVQLIVAFQLKSSRPLSLFPVVVQQYLFKEFHTYPVVGGTGGTTAAASGGGNVADTVLNTNRTKFALTAISAIVQTIPVYSESESDSDYIVNQSKHYSLANKWFGKILTISREWDLNIDEIRRKFVYDLYYYGCDQLAEEAVTSVVDVMSLGQQLATVAGIRVLAAINQRYGSVDQMHTLPTNILFWLKNLSTDTNCYTASPVRLTIALLQHINNYVNSDKHYSRISDTLLETIKILDRKQ
ncbi:rab3 GTPase-activating protein non-catalytic subunit-like isoform X2 [Oppia nitens]|uniref:rab3 GTPase-activating protein non-catalytic subunit-like isoform X2 n=1 Tax=Oppia nitens TaxID=1686743 RepID=UPI0023DA14A4|nr:rab3 GTPase-activating protein non-catalytic subunit-like isoform X2 [Oppia nitens]